MAAEATQTVYLWQGTDRAGNSTRGEIHGSSQALVKAQLRKQGVNPVRVRRKPGKLLRPRQPKITPQDIAVFTRQLATLIKAGIPLVQSFEIVSASLENAAMSKLILQLRDDLATGNSFADCIRQHPRHFDQLFCNLVDAGEQSGALETMLERLATYQEKSEALRAKVKKAMTYPIVVLVVAIVVTGILLVKVVPQFAGTFASFGAELPAFTRLVMQLSDFAIAHWWQAGLVTLAIVWLFRRAKSRSTGFHNLLQRSVLKMPIIGSIIRHSCYARFTRTLATTFAAGVPLVDALNSAAGATGNVVYTDAARHIRDDVTDGLQLNLAISNTGLFPAMVTRMVSIGEESGALDAMLDKCAVYYEAAVDESIDGLTVLLEPVIMTVLGMLIGGLMIAMYLPIFQLGAVI